MSCPHCGRKPDAPGPACPHCPDARLPARQNADNARDPHSTVVDAEIVDEKESSAAGSHIYYQQFRTGSGGGFGGSGGGPGGFRAFTWRSGPGFAMGGDSCLPGIITLFMVLACAVQSGALAAVAFFFFYLIGSGIAAFANLQRIMQGRPLNPWVSRAVVWGACWLLTTWLAG